MKPNIELTITNHLFNKIKYLCSRIPNNEWSGILIYQTKGSPRDFCSFSLTATDLIPMDMGSATSTNFTMNEPPRNNQIEGEDALVDYFRLHPSALPTSKIGLIHSHQNFNTFFSGTDMEELRDNATSHDFYLSLIVNNNFQPIAKLMFLGNATTTVTITMNDECGNAFTYTEPVQQQYPFYYELDCIIYCDEHDCSYKEPNDNFFLQRVEHIIKKAVLKEQINSKLPGKLTTEFLDENDSSLPPSFKSLAKRLRMRHIKPTH